MALLLCGVLGVAASGRVSGNFQPLPGVFKDISLELDKTCERERSIEVIQLGQANCILGDSSIEPSFFVLGDSHAWMWSTALDALAKEHQLQGITLAYAGCMPVFDFYLDNQYKDCLKLFPESLQYIIKSPIKNVIIISRWNNAVKILDHNNTANPSAFINSLSQVLDKLTAAGKTVYIVHNTPELINTPFVLESFLKARNSPEKNIYCEIPYQQSLKLQQINKAIEKLKSKYNFTTITPSLIMQNDKNKVLVIHDSKPIYTDDNHLTAFGSLHFRDVFLPVIKDILAQQQNATRKDTQPATLQ